MKVLPRMCFCCAPCWCGVILHHSMQPRSISDAFQCSQRAPFLLLDHSTVGADVEDVLRRCVWSERGRGSFWIISNAAAVRTFAHVLPLTSLRLTVKHSSIRWMFLCVYLKKKQKNKSDCILIHCDNNNVLKEK